MKLSRKQAVAKFRKMWKWIAKETKKRQKVVLKEDYFIENNIEEIPLNYCYLCSVTYDGCDNCPVKWKEDNCYESISEYSECLDARYAGDYRRAYEMALKISRLKEKG